MPNKEAKEIMPKLDEEPVDARRLIDIGIRLEDNMVLGAAKVRALRFIGQGCSSITGIAEIIFRLDQTPIADD